MKMTDMFYKVHCKDFPGSYIGVTSRPMDIRLKDHHAKADKVTRPELLPTNKGNALRQTSTAKHATIENHGTIPRL